MLFSFSGGVLLGCQFASWVTSGNWHNIPVSLAIPRCDEVQAWLYQLNPSADWYDYVSKAFAIPLGAVLIAISFCVTRRQPSLRYSPPSLRM